MGSCVHWDWRHFHYELHSVDLRSWLADSGRSILKKISAAWNLPDDAIKRPVRGSMSQSMANSAGHNHSLLVSTAAATALLIHQACVMCNSPARRAKCSSIAGGWARLSDRGLALVRDNPIYMSVDLGDSDVTVHLLPSGYIGGMAPLLADAPRLEARWAESSTRLGGFASSLDSPSPADLLMFLADLPPSLKSTKPWIKALACNINSIVALGIEAYIVRSYIPAHGRDRELQPLKGRHRSRNFDPITKERIGKRVDTVGGSAAHTSKALAGSQWHAGAWRHATILIFNSKSVSSFHQQKQISLAADPGAYSGEATNVGCIYGTRTRVSAVLPAKALKCDAFGFPRVYGEGMANQAHSFRNTGADLCVPQGAVVCPIRRGAQ